MSGHFLKKARRNIAIAIHSLVKSNVAAAAQAMWQDIKPEKTVAAIRLGDVMKRPNTAVLTLIRQEIKSVAEVKVLALKIYRIWGFLLLSN